MVPEIPCGSAHKDSTPFPARRQAGEHRCQISWTSSHPARRLGAGAGWWSRGEAPPSAQILVGYQGLTPDRAAIWRLCVTVVRNKGGPVSDAAILHLVTVRPRL